MAGRLRVGSIVKSEEHDTNQYERTVSEVFSEKKQRNAGTGMVEKGYAEIYAEYAYQCNGNKLTKFENKARKRDQGDLRCKWICHTFHPRINY